MTAEPAPAEPASSEQGPTAPDRDSSMGTWWWVIGALVAVVIVAAGLVALLGATSGSQGTTVTYTIPAGTTARLDRGERLVVLPAEITLARGSELVLVNEDSKPFEFGSITIGPGQVMRTRFSEAGSFRNLCTLNPAQAVTITVT